MFLLSNWINWIWLPQYPILTSAAVSLLYEWENSHLLFLQSCFKKAAAALQSCMLHVISKIVHVPKHYGDVVISGGQQWQTAIFFQPYFNSNIQSVHIKNPVGYGWCCAVSPWEIVAALDVWAGLHAQKNHTFLKGGLLFPLEKCAQSYYSRVTLSPPSWNCNCILCYKIYYLLSAVVNFTRRLCLKRH